MKRCHTCGEDFEDKFSFCPIDATALNKLAADITNAALNNDSPADLTILATCCSSAKQRSIDYYPTIVDSTSFVDRLVDELACLGERTKLAWSRFKESPTNFAREIFIEAESGIRGLLTSRNLAAGVIAPLLVLFSILLVLWLGDRMARKPASLARDEEAIGPATILTFKSTTEIKPAGAGVGEGGKGTVGFAQRKGQGSERKDRPSHGGGGGGLGNPLPVQQGRPPQPSLIPAPIPAISIPRKVLVPAGLDIDPALWKSLPFSVYGDPRSHATTASNGPGNGGGMGTGDGQGVGEGKGPGFGPGEKGNIGGGPNSRGGGGGGGSDGNNTDVSNVPIPASQATERARLLFKPEPQYTEEARRNQITGTVVLRVVFSLTGQVTNIRVVSSLPFGLTERAIAAARQIRFLPATKNGRPVPVYMQLEYSFNLY